MGGEAIDRGFLAVLKGFPLFSALQDEQLKEVTETAKLSDFERDKMIVREGERSTTLYVILKGLVEIGRTGPRLLRGSVQVSSLGSTRWSATRFARRPCLPCVPRAVSC